MECPDLEKKHIALHKWAEESGLEYEWYAKDYLVVDLPPGRQQFDDSCVPSRMATAAEICFENDG